MKILSYAFLALLIGPAIVVADVKKIASKPVLPEASAHTKIIRSLSDAKEYSKKKAFSDDMRAQPTYELLNGEQEFHRATKRKIYVVHGDKIEIKTEKIQPR